MRYGFLVQAIWAITLIPRAIVLEFIPYLWCYFVHCWDSWEEIENDWLSYERCTKCDRKWHEDSCGIGY